MAGDNSATNLLAQLRDRTASSLELVESRIAHIEVRNPAINVVVAKDYQRATEKARVR